MVGFKIKVGIDYRQVVPWYLLPDVALFSLVTCHDVSHTIITFISFFFLFSHGFSRDTIAGLTRRRNLSRLLLPSFVPTVPSRRDTRLQTTDPRPTIEAAVDRRLVVRYSHGGA